MSSGDPKAVRTLNPRERILNLDDVDGLQKALGAVQGQVDNVTSTLCSRALYEADTDVREGVIRDLHEVEEQLAKLQGLVVCLTADGPMCVETAKPYR